MNAMNDWTSDDGRAVMHCGDCVDVMREMADNSVDMIATDPPYFKVKTEAWDRQWDDAGKFIAWIGVLADEWRRILKPNGSLYVFASPRMAARVEVCVAERMNVLNRVVWAKPAHSTKAEMNPKEWQRNWFPVTEYIIFAEHYGADNIAKGEAGYGAKCDELRGFVFEPLRAYLAGERDRAGLTNPQVNKLLGTQMASHYFTTSQWALPTEQAYNKLRDLFNRAGGEYLRREYEELRTQYEELRTQYEELRTQYEELRRPFTVTADVPYTDVWSFPTVQAYKGKHPCEKPLAMMEHIITASSKPDAVVLDCFAGSNTTGEAALSLGRKYIGVEKDDAWHRRGVERLQRVADSDGLFNIQ